MTEVQAVVFGTSGRISARQDYVTDGMSEQQLTFLQHLREFGLVYQRKVTDFLALRHQASVVSLVVLYSIYFLHLCLHVYVLTSGQMFSSGWITIS